MISVNGAIIFFIVIVNASQSDKTFRPRRSPYERIHHVIGRFDRRPNPK